MKFIATEIKLCQDIAKKYRKEIKYGDWYYHRIEEDCLVYTAVSTRSVIEDEFPLLTLEDCLEFLRERKWLFESLTQNDDLIWELKVLNPDRTEIIDIRSKAPLEACLKAILEVLKNEEIQK